MHFGNKKHLLPNLKPRSSWTPMLSVQSVVCVPFYLAMYTSPFWGDRLLSIVLKSTMNHYNLTQLASQNWNSSIAIYEKKNKHPKPHTFTRSHPPKPSHGLRFQSSAQQPFAPNENRWDSLANPETRTSTVWTPVGRTNDCDPGRVKIKRPEIQWVSGVK